MPCGPARPGIGGIQLPQMKLAQQLLALFFPFAARRNQCRIVRRPINPFLQLQHPPELLTMADGAVDEKRASVATVPNAGWNVTARNPAYRSVVHPISPSIWVPHPLAPNNPPKRCRAGRTGT